MSRELLVQQYKSTEQRVASQWTTGTCGSSTAIVRSQPQLELEVGPSQMIGLDQRSPCEEENGKRPRRLGMHFLCAV